MLEPKQSKSVDYLPAYTTIKRWTALTGISRSKTYELLSNGKLYAIKLDGRTLIDVSKSLDWLANQPTWKSGE